MYPFVMIFDRAVSMYTVCALSGLVFAFLLILILARVHKTSIEDCLYTLVFCVMGMGLGALLLNYITKLPAYIPVIHTLSKSTGLQGLIEGLKFFLMDAGFVFYGGLLGAIVTFFVYTKWMGFDTDKMLVTMLPAIPLFAGFGRIGCFLIGCCYGKEATGILEPVGIAFTDSPIAPNGIRLVPVALFEAGFDLVLTILLVTLSVKKAKGKKLLMLYLALYAVFRFFAEFLRGDLVRGIWFGLSTSQWISILILIVVIASYISSVRVKKVHI